MGEEGQKTVPCGATRFTYLYILTIESLKTLYALLLAYISFFKKKIINKKHNLTRLYYL